jgi:DNA-directed DNA polymerase|nr:MAG TPA: DNA polymerase I [Caudoviricetes sp.]
MKDLVEITLDFETYYSKKDKYSLTAKGMTIEKYVRNPKFEIIGLAVKVGNKPTEWLKPAEIEDWIKHIEIAYGWDNVRVIAHNARFDAAILGWIYNIYPKQIADTMLMSRACQLWDGHSLDNVTKELRNRYNWGIVRGDNGQTIWGKFEMKDLPDTLNKGDEVVNADGKQLFDFTEAEYDAYADYCITDVDLTWSAYNWFMKERKFPAKEIDVMTLTIEMFTFPVIELHIPVLQEVEKVINEKRQALLDKVGVTTEDLRSDAKFAMLLSELGVDPPTKLNPKGETKYAFAKKDLGFIKLLEHDDPAVVELVEARLGNKSSQAVTRVKSLLEMSDRGLLPIPLEYYAAHTGRWGGSDGINLQNFNRNQLVDKDTPVGTKVFYADKADVVVKVLDDGKVQLARAGVVENDEELLHIMGLRDALKAPKGKKLVVFDLAQVELRANSWMWGEEWVLDTLVQGKDIYKVTAANTYGIPYEEVNKSQRFVGKSQQLGLGYGAGINGLKVVMGKRSEEFTDDELQSFVNAYRSAASNIVRGWKQCKSALGAMVSGVAISFCKDNILSTDGHRIALPNGLHLTYRDIHVRPGEMGPELWFWGKNKQTKKPDWEKTFSGKCDENCCQSLCRIIMGDIMIAIREDFAKRNWSRDDAHICLTVHDEVIVCCKDELAEEVSEIMQYQMKKSRDWYHDLPLDCAGDIAQRYGCAK